MTAFNIPYVPISCAFHDVLEHLAMRRQPVQLRFRAADGSVQQRTARIDDLYSQRGEEYLRTDGGDTLRLDRLLQADGVRLADYQADACAI